MLLRLVSKTPTIMATCMAGLIASRPRLVVLPTAVCSRCLCMPTRVHSSTFTAQASFSQQHAAPGRRCMAVKAGQTDDGSNDPAQQQLKETAALDQLIDAMLAAKNQQELTQVVATNLLQCNQRFWLRLATRSDGAASQEEKDQLSALSRTVMLLVDALVKEAEGQMSQSSEVLTEVLTAAAEDNGEWELPLRAEKLAAMRQVMQNRAESLDEAFLGSAFAWMRKAKDDKLDGVVALLQKVLQVYAAQQLSGVTDTDGSSSTTDTATELLDAVLAADEGEWETLLRSALEEGRTSQEAFTQALQRRMEHTVLGMSSGSYKQRVLAEYLKELASRADALFAVQV